MGQGRPRLFNVITGVFPPNGGAIALNGMSIEGRKAREIARLGVSRTFQNVEVFGRMTVLENVMVGRHIQSRAGIISTGLRLRRDASGRATDPGKRDATSRIRRAGEQSNGVGW